MRVDGAHAFALGEAVALRAEGRNVTGLPPERRSAGKFLASHYARSADRFAIAAVHARTIACKTMVAPASASQPDVWPTRERSMSSRSIFRFSRTPITRAWRGSPT